MTRNVVGTVVTSVRRSAVETVVTAMRRSVVMSVVKSVVMSVVRSVVKSVIKAVVAKGTSETADERSVKPFERRLWSTRTSDSSSPSLTAGRGRASA